VLTTKIVGLDGSSFNKQWRFQRMEETLISLLAAVVSALVIVLSFDLYLGV
jgi:hypothetical protein